MALVSVLEVVVLGSVVVEGFEGVVGLISSDVVGSVVVVVVLGSVVVGNIVVEGS